MPVPEYQKNDSSVGHTAFLHLHSYPVGRFLVKQYIFVASFPGLEEGEEKERLVYTVCTCTYLPRISMSTVFV